MDTGGPLSEEDIITITIEILTTDGDHKDKIFSRNENNKKQGMWCHSIYLAKIVNSADQSFIATPF